MLNKGAILDPSNENYMVLPTCDSEHEDFVIIHLSEEVQVGTILVSNHEDFSANLDQITFFGSIDYPPPNDHWVSLGSIRPNRLSREFLSEYSDGNNHLLDLEKNMGEE